jgi:regulation of enolase protein 1 (concanavalin A-like superfamily)
MQWHHEPPTWHQDGDVITAVAGPQTDFWRKTHDSGVRDHGHFLGQAASGDFTAEVKVSGRYADQYDQAGLMVRRDETCWLKCGIELVDGRQHASVVVTRDWSDWSMLPLDNPPLVWLRIVRHGATLQVSYSLDGHAYSMIRQAFLTDASTVRVGPMLAAPKGNGFAATFEHFRVEPG